MAALTVRVRLSTGVTLDLSLPADASVGALRAILAERTTILAEEQQIRCGFPPRPLGSAGVGGDASPLVAAIGGPNELLQLTVPPARARAVHAGSARRRPPRS
mmetsp:Transcript_35619/g.88751  ORF Transcript_35619/g.88751 Transcript_35619/m.88751 type:complete len:103 (+) Transcript_35619:165-473(+)